VANGLLQDLAENERSGNPGFSMLCEEAQILSVDRLQPDKRKWLISPA